MKWKGYENSFNSWIDKNDLVWFCWLLFCCIKMSQYFPEPFEQFGGDININVDLSNFATKQTLKIFHMLILQILH